jgi:hypothetical protein
MLLKCPGHVNHGRFPASPKRKDYFKGVPDALWVSFVHVAIIADDLTGAADTWVQFACLNAASVHELNVCPYVPQKRPEAKPRWCVILCVIELSSSG